MLGRTAQTIADAREAAYLKGVEAGARDMRERAAEVVDAKGEDLPWGEWQVYERLAEQVKALPLTAPSKGGS
jgi:hypothetical protein